MSPIGNRRHFLKILSSITGFFLLGAALVIFLGCEVSDVNKQNSVSSGTTTGSGSSGGATANVSVTAASTAIASAATTAITVILTDSSGRRTDAAVILTSSGGGTFTYNGKSDKTLDGYTLGGVLVATFTAPSVSSQTNIEISAMVKGTNIKGSTIISVGSNTISTHMVIPSTSGTGSGTIAPSTPQIVNHGSTTTFIVSTTGVLLMQGTCGGVQTGSSPTYVYTTYPIVSDCTVIANIN